MPGWHVKYLDLVAAFFLNDKVCQWCMGLLDLVVAFLKDKICQLHHVI
jgi:hypothetical protein